jgi:LysM repeat protein
VDRVRVWILRLIAPLAFLAAATVLVVVIGRALDDEGDSSPTSAPVQATQSETVPVTTEAAETESGERQFYRIKAGDTLESIATKFDTTVDELLVLNPELDPLALEPGKRIRVA